MRARVLLVVLIGTGACGGDPAPAPAPAATAVTVQAARLESLREVVAAPGVVVPSALADFVVTAVESAEIVELPRAEGDAVREGDLLVRFEIPAITSTLLARQTDVVEATTRAQNARAEVVRLTAYYDKGVLPRNTLDAARTSLLTAESALQQAKAQLDASKLLTERAIVRARFAGIVVKVWHKVGDIAAADPADPIVRVVDPNRTQVAIQVPLAQIDRVTPGRAATILPGAGPVEAAAVSSRSAPAAPGAPTIEVRLSFTGPSGLKIDTPVQAEILLDERRAVLVAPESAIQRQGAVAFVWIARQDGRAERREVGVGLTVNGLSQILSGVVAGERIIVTGISQLEDGAPITVTNAGRG